MHTSFAKDLYSESLELSTTKLTDPTTSLSLKGLNFKPNLRLREGDLQDEDDDGHLWDWHKMHNELHAIGYRNGLIAGKEAIAQEGFNIGFKQSVIAGYNWGTVRGVTSALSSLPDSLKEKLVQAEENRQRFHELHELVNSITTTHALKLFHEDVLAEEAAGKKIKHNETGGAELQKGSSRSCSSHLGIYAEELHSLLHDAPAIESDLLGK